MDLAVGDLVIVHDGLVQNSAAVIWTFRGGETIEDGARFLISSGSSMLVTYVSTSDNPGEGFNFLYREGMCEH